MKLPRKALAATSLLLIVPLMTATLLERHEHALRHIHDASIRASARIISAALANDDRVISALGIQPRGSKPLFASRLKAWVDVDGRREGYGERVAVRRLTVDDALQVNAPFEDSSLGVTLRTATDGVNLFVHADITDDRVVYRELGSLSVHRNDHLQLAFVDPDDNYRRYTVAPSQPGPADVFRIASFSQGSRALRPDEEVEGYWRATDSGYAVEVRIPLTIMSSDFAVSVSDVDSEQDRRVLYTLGSASTTFEEDIGHIILPDPALDRLLSRLTGDTGGYVGLLNDAGQILAEAGDPSHEGIWQDTRGPVLPLPFYQHSDAPVTGREPVALSGKTAGELVVIQSPAGRDRAVNQVIETLTVISAVFIVAAGALMFGFTRWIAARISRLRGQLASSVDSQGRVRDSVPPSGATDELGELHDTFRQLTDRLQQYNRYLEQVSRRLSHELRTPVTVVSSSLDNLSMQSGNAEDVYIERARDGVSRLSRILSSMSEATRLESSLNPEDVEYFDLAAVIEGCVQGYQTAYPEQRFELSVEAAFDPVLGLPDLVSQLMDKLIGNAVEFAAPNSPIRVRLTREADDAVLRVMNEGPPLPASGDHLFDSMISIREAETAEGTHLGLGLYIARLIAEFHGGSIDIADRADISGVIVTTRFPLMRIRGERP